MFHGLGKKPTFNSEDGEFSQAVEHVLNTAKGHGVAPGIHVPDAESALRRQEEGFQFIAITSEVGMMLAKATETVNTLGLGRDKPAVARY